MADRQTNRHNDYYNPLCMVMRVNQTYAAGRGGVISNLLSKIISYIHSRYFCLAILKNNNSKTNNKHEIPATTNTTNKYIEA